MRQLLKKDWVIMVISILVSIALWIYVSYVVSPEYVRVIEDIPLTFTNKSSDFDTGKLKIISNNCDSITVEIKGDRRVIASIVPDNIVASIDLLNVVKSGNYSLPVSVNFGVDGVEIQQKTPQKCEIVVDDVVVEEKEIRIVTKGELKEGYTLGELTVSPATVKITGPKTHISKIAKVEAVVDISGKDTDIRTNAMIKLVDVNGKVLNPGEKGTNIPFVNVNLDETTVHYTVSNRKIVPVKPNLSNSINRVDITTSWEIVGENKNITIWGASGVIKDINEIFTEPIDISYISDGEVVEVRAIIPEGVETDYNGEKFKVKFSIQDIQN